MIQVVCFCFANTAYVMKIKSRQTEHTPRFQLFNLASKSLSSEDATGLGSETTWEHNPKKIVFNCQATI